VLLERGGQLGEPERLHVFELLLEVGDLVVSWLVGQIAELSAQLRLHVVAAENVHQLQDV